MKKKLLVVGALSLAAFSAVGVTATMAANGGILFADTSSSSKYVWMHYAKKAATKTEKGIREYWANCNTHEIVYEKPVSTSIGDSVAYDTTGFATDDARWIYNVTLDAKEVVMTDATKAFDLGTDYTGATITSMKAGDISLGTDASALDVSAFAEDHSDDGVKSVEIELNKDGKYSTLFFDTTFVTAYLYDNPTSFDVIKPICATTTDHNVNGYYRLAENISLNTFNGKASGSDTGTSWGWLNGWLDSGKYTFKGTLDGNGKTINGQSTYNGLFNQLNGATIKNLTLTEGWWRENGGDYSMLAGSMQNTTLENVTIKVVGGSKADTFAPDLTKEEGFISRQRFMSNTLKNVNIDASDYNIAVVFASKNGNDNSFTNCNLKVKSYAYLWNHWKTGRLTTYDGLTVTGTVYTASSAS